MNSNNIYFLIRHVSLPLSLVKFCLRETSITASLKEKNLSLSPPMCVYNYIYKCKIICIYNFKLNVASI